MGGVDDKHELGARKGQTALRASRVLAHFS